ncbi:amino acid ABC transporter permease [Caballeronia sordidicola]|jgi:polar amino acid transport system permease protein|uniref:Glutamate/aspartate import permease protein GltK n=1 Tax=Caballeronia sordidicola TaxID=196367 RepID=A0A226X5M2_CABSO|nr:amino acid ABC transporter permease [Caballeronia sordidicola]OXC78277.1 ABC transporter permease protein [Caballeronia sordidicola]
MLSASNDRASASGNADSFTDISQFEHVPRRYYGRYLASVVILAIVAYIVVAFARGQIDWVVVGRFLTAKSILKGLGNTIVMTILAMALGIVLGVIVAIMRLSTNPVLQAVAQAYVWLFRGTPVILQLLLWFNLALVFPVMGIPGLFEVRTVDIMTPFLAALLGLGVSQGAYTSEVVRAGLLSVDTGQYEAAKSIGMPKLQALRRVILPQAMRVIVPPIGNELIGMVKLTSLASVIQYAEMLHSAENIYYANARVIELLMVAGVWYLVVVTVLSLLQSRVELRFARGAGRASAKQ